jgi:3-dehydroquinate dehydratase-2
MPARRILVLHGPNLNLLSGARSVEAIDAALLAKAVTLGVEVKAFQSNWEGALLDKLAAERHWFDGVIVNPATLAPSAVGLAEALRLLKKPAIEVQLDDVKKGKSALKDAVEKQIAGRGSDGYLEALVALAPKARAKDPFSPSGVEGRTVPPLDSARGERVARSERPAKAAKSIGRDVSADKSIGRVLPTGEIVKSIGVSRQKPPGRKPPAPSAPKSVGRRIPVSDAGILTRAIVRQQIADRLSGVVTPAALAAWSRAHWQKLQSGTPIESGQREVLEDVLQQLVLSATSKPSDDQLIELMTQLAP